MQRLERRLSINRLDNPEDYLALLRESDKEKVTLTREMLIGVTRFFRDREAFSVLEKTVLPALAHRCFLAKPFTLEDLGRALDALETAGT